ncbi:MAG: hypothetical protein WCL39_06320 [Armatimonadota bacterium]
MVENEAGNEKYYALVKFEVSADEFGAVYSFDYYICSSAGAAAEEIGSRFLDRVDGAISYADASYHDQLSANKEVLETRIKDAVKKAQSGDSDASISHFSAAIDVAYPLYSFSVLASGSGKDFVPICILALREDEEVGSFCECALEEIDEEEESPEYTTEQTLALELESLFNSDLQALTLASTLGYLERIKETICTEEEM